MVHPDSLASLQKLCDRHARLLVISHVRPDGDAYGSTLGLTPVSYTHLDVYKRQSPSSKRGAATASFSRACCKSSFNERVTC